MQLLSYGERIPVILYAESRTRKSNQVIQSYSRMSLMLMTSIFLVERAVFHLPQSNDVVIGMCRQFLCSV